MLKHALAAAIIGIALFSCKPKSNIKVTDEKPMVTQEDSAASRKNIDEFGIPTDNLKVAEHNIKKNEGLYLILDKFDFSSRQIYAITQKARKVIDIKSFRPGQTYRTYSSDNGDSMPYLVWQKSPVEFVVFDWHQDSTQIYKAAKPLTRKTVVSAGKIEHSLYQTISDVDATPLLAHKLAEVYAWEINFFGLRDGDAFKVLYDKKFIDNEFYGTGMIRAAKFKHRGKTYRAYHFSHGGFDGYFNEKGESVQRALLKTPFKFNHRISSRFSPHRFHPILKRSMPHYGVDFAAPVGTPVLAVGKGRVSEARYSRTAGNMIKIIHNSTYKTAYFHLNKFARGLHPGTRVKQGEVIGYVGSTGRSTGPHLDYRIYKNNKPVNPMTIELPSADSVPDSLEGSFLKIRRKLDKRLQSADDSLKKGEEEKDYPVVSQANF